MILDTEWFRLLSSQMQAELGAKKTWTLDEIMSALDRAIAWSLINYSKP